MKARAMKSKSVQNNFSLGALEGDGVMEKDPLAIGLYKTMLVLRSEEDIEEGTFGQYEKFRNVTLEKADEVWKMEESKSVEFHHNIFYFIREFHGEEVLNGDSFYYVVSTLEEPRSNSHSILFSFPTKDTSLLERYQKGELFETDEVIQEDSH